MKLALAVAWFVVTAFTGCARPPVASAVPAASTSTKPETARSSCVPCAASAAPESEVPAASARWESSLAVDEILGNRDGVPPEKRFAKRCTLGPLAPLRLSTADAPFATTPAPPFAMDAVVAEEGSDDLRVVTGDDHVRVVAFVARRAALVVTSERVAVTSRAEDASTDAPIHLAAGVPVAVVETAGKMRQIHADIDGVDVFGWLASDKIGATFTPSTPPKSITVDAELAWGATVTDAAGHVLAHFPAAPPSDNAFGNGIDVKLVLGAAKGRQGLVWTTDRIDVRGFADSALVRKKPVTSLQSDSVSALGSLGFESDTEQVVLSAGASLFDAEGFRVGVVLRRVDGFAAFGAHARGELRGVDVEIDGLGFASFYVRAR